MLLDYLNGTGLYILLEIKIFHQGRKFYLKFTAKLLKNV